MAERRMFAKTIIDSDAFLDMPLSAQALYFHLSMRADDEGFINNPKKIQRMVGASDDDAKLLIAKKFIIPFETGVVVIKHWRIHNYIRPDRLVPTKYREEREMLDIKDNGAYTLGQAVAEIESLDAKDVRKLAYKNSSLPYSFDYKIRRAFEGKKCPICGCDMSGAYKKTMPTVQHNLPISQGGEHELENISVICRTCNCSIRDNPTEKLNNSEVIKMWDRIVASEAQGMEWFSCPEILMSVKCPSNVGQMSVNGQPMDGIGKDRIGKDIDSIGDINPPTPLKGEKRKAKPAPRAVYSDDPALDDAIHEFIKHRKAMRKPMTDKAIELFVNKLNKLAPGDNDKQIQLINTAIERGWQTVYEENGSGGGAAKMTAAQQHMQAINDELDRIIRGEA